MSEPTHPDAGRPAGMPTIDQVSAGGVAYRNGPAGYEVALILVGPKGRWQLPKGLVDPGETPEATAVREVREEAGIDTDFVAPLETIEYWYVGRQRGRSVRFHKHVHFYLLAYRAGDVRDHDHEVEEARWFALEEAPARLTFASERRVVDRARAWLERNETPEGRSNGPGLP